MRTDVGSRRSRGFILPVVLGLILIAALLAIEAGSEMGTQSMLATNRLLHQRAFESGESGIVEVMEQMQAGLSPPATQQLPSAAFPTDGASVEFTTLATVALPAGHSAGRIVETHREIRSSGYSARDTRVIVVQGLSQRMAVAEP